MHALGKCSPETRNTSDDREYAENDNATLEASDEDEYAESRWCTHA